MKSKDYWQKRFEDLEKAQINKGIEFYSNVEKQYNAAISNIEKELSKWYSRYATENGISLADAKKILTKGELAEFKMSVEEYIEKGRTLAYSNEFKDELKKASARFHVSRLEALKLQMQEQIEFLGAKTTDGLTKHLTDVYTGGYYRTAFEVQKGLGVGFSVSELDSKEINKVLSKPWASDGKTFSNRIWDNQRKLVNEVNDLLSQNVTRGLSVNESIKILSDKMNVSKHQAARLIITETAYFSSEATKDSYHELDVEQYEILASLDSKTSETCRNLDGKVFDLKDYQSGITAPPFHPYCRTTTVPYFDDEVEGYRASRDEKDKGYYLIPENMNYREWEDGFIKGGNKTALTKIDKSNLDDVINNKPKTFKGVVGDLLIQTGELTTRFESLPNLITTANNEIQDLTKKIEPLNNDLAKYNNLIGHDFKSELAIAREELERLEELNRRNKAISKRYYTKPTENMSAEEIKAFRKTDEYKSWLAFKENPATIEAANDYDTPLKLDKTKKLIDDLLKDEEFYNTYDYAKNKALLDKYIKAKEKKLREVKNLIEEKEKIPVKINENIHKAGKEFIKELKVVKVSDEIIELEKEYDDLRKKAKANNNKLSSNDYNRYEKLRNEISDLRLELGEKQTENVMKLLRQIRDIGVKDDNLLKAHLPGNSQIKKYVVDGYDYYPSDWIEKSFNASSLSLKKVSRGYYLHSTNTLAISTPTEYKALRTSIHELGHRFEYVHPVIRTQEKLFYDRRTKGEQSKWLGAGYSKREVTKKDNFIDAYIGKDYGDNTYEVVSMGFERAFIATDDLLKDEDYAEFIFGVLSIL